MSDYFDDSYPASVLFTEPSSPTIPADDSSESPSSEQENSE